jgi:MFS family permease
MAAKTVLQEYTPQRWMGLITTLNESVSQAAPGIGILLGGVIATIANPRIAFAIAGVGSLGYAVASWIALRPSAMPPRPVQRDQGLADEGGNGLPTAAAAGSPAETPTAGPNRETLVP